MPILHSSTRRPSPLRDTDYDHEITLVDHTATLQPPRSQSANSASHRIPSPSVRQKLRQEITRRRYKKYQDRRLDEERPDPAQPEGFQEDAREQGQAQGVEDRGRKKAKTKPESAIEILYENQRGGFLCGLPLFASKALGNLDPSPWTNIAQKTSATDITNAQVPDPSWEWEWKEWTINHDEGTDEDGWEYSFAFAKLFSWHGPTWWNSFVRRRAWIRKRVRKGSGYHISEAHKLNADYFTIHSASLEASRSRASSVDTRRLSAARLASCEMEDEILAEDITDIGALMVALRLARIDREKMEAVENFIKNGGEDLYYLQERMHDIMGAFIFQASRRLLLTHVLRIYNETAEQNKEHVDDEYKKKRLENLEAALKHADEEVRKLEYWSDVKDMAEKGYTKGAVDKSQGWDSRWAGLDDSGPKDVISKREQPGFDSRKDGEGKVTAGSADEANRKGKGKERTEE
ncbi:Meiotically up-regulated protein 65 protein [Lachnellula occidentalis]|uniref:Meiotically up-regulated protein 65 protein n=1 Tax=Lachnellula occidentalis TaxID=215460 RepID=A0A8H8RT58_9HELO|nr:Meiotically up-regulated protein 65 protein [Lachnellula occidentalis]